ncbi:hypothetical protein [Pseudomonas sp. Irchel s3h17]|uniref:hypothetical protein n=1 Tax=Pseudomonas sp. Irchel s3h17 TaxID=2009182 RepID=UPI000BA4B7B4|nr:hypothetical protein [Pseudomonas sp. Irchel s3h17]
MHPSFQERFDELCALLQKTKAAQTGLFGRTDRQEPPKPVRFQVNVKGIGLLQIVDRTSGKAHAFRQDYKAAHDLAMQYEEKVNRLTGGAQ